MEPSTESVKINKKLLGIYREWGRSSGRSMRFLLERALQDAASHFSDGQLAGLREANHPLVSSEAIPIRIQEAHPR